MSSEAVLPSNPNDVPRQAAALRAWRWINGPHLLAIVTVLLGVFFLGWGLWPDASSAVQPSAGRSEGIAATVVRVFHSSRLMRGVLGLYAALLLLRVATLLYPGWDPLPNGPLEEHRLTLDEDMQAYRLRLRQVLKDAGMSTAASAERDDDCHLCAVDKLNRRLWSGLLYAGLCLLLLVQLLRSPELWPNAAWRATPVSLCIGETAEMDGALELALRLDRLAYRLDEAGRMAWFESRVDVLEAGSRQAHLTLRPNRGGTYEGLRLHQVGYGPAVRVQLWNGQQPLMLYALDDPGQPQEVLRLRFDERHQDRMLAAPDAGLVLRLTRYMEEERFGSVNQFRLEVLRASDGETLLETLVAEDSGLTLQGLRIELGIEYYATLQTSRDRLLWLTALSVLMTLIGLVGHLLLTPRRLWLSLWTQDGDTICRLAVPKPHRDSDWFQRLRSSLEGLEGWADQ